VAQLIAVDAHGTLQLSASYSPTIGDGSLRLQSKIDLQSLARLWPVPQLDDVAFYAPPTLELTATMRAAQEPRLQLIGHVDLPRFSYRTVVFESLTTDFAWESERWAARDVRLVHRTGEVTGDVMKLSADFSQPPAEHHEPRDSPASAARRSVNLVPKAGFWHASGKPPLGC
jgi:hypothetical protein